MTRQESKQSMEEEEEEAATLEGQFFEFSRLLNTKHSGLTITLWCSDYWMRQSKLLDDRNLTMTDTGLLWSNNEKTEIDFDEWHKFLEELCDVKSLDLETVELALKTCGLPGIVTVMLPQYRNFFLTYKPKGRLNY